VWQSIWWLGSTLRQSSLLRIREFMVLFPLLGCFLLCFCLHDTLLLPLGLHLSSPRFILPSLFGSL
jgi:hypothetical protein